LFMVFIFFCPHALFIHPSTSLLTFFLTPFRRAPRVLSSSQPKVTEVNQPWKEEKEIAQSRSATDKQPPAINTSNSERHQS
jgi:hypothetical protein